MKVAAYCRVSTDKSDQQNSLKAQQCFFEMHITGHPGWQLYKIYADKGATGTSTQHRPAFNQMISDALAGRFGLILTKEISRFARNLLDSVYYTRLLKEHGIGVFFINDNINTLDSASELIFALKSTMAQEESRAISERVKWGQSRSMEKGVVFGRALLGYTLKDGALKIEPNGAKTVRLIFNKYVYDNMGAGAIAAYLDKSGYPPPGGSPVWRPGTILKIIKNEKYCGDLKQKKTITPNYLTHRKAPNRGSEPFICIKDHHAPIIPRPLWLKAQKELSRRTHTRGTGGHGRADILSGKIKCKNCGKSLALRTRTAAHGTQYKTWRCSCGLGFQLNDQIIGSMLAQTLPLVITDKNALEKLTQNLITKALSIKNQHALKERADIKSQLKKLYNKKKALLDSYLENTITKKELLLLKSGYDKSIKALEKELKNQISLVQQPPPSLSELLDFEKSARLYTPLIDSITACPDRTLVLRYKGLKTTFEFKLK